MNGILCIMTMYIAQIQTPKVRHFVEYGNIFFTFLSLLTYYIYLIYPMGPTNMVVNYKTNHTELTFR